METKNISLLFTSKQLIKHYMHIGVNYRNVNRSNSYFLLGLYRNISIINLSKILPMLKKRFFFFFKFMIKSFSKVLLITGLRFELSEYLIKKLNSLHMDYFFGRWWNGFIKNFKIFSKTRLTAEDNINISRLPNYIFYMPFNDNLNDISGYAASREFNSTGIHSLIFFDSHKNISFIKAGVMLNTKALLNSYFIITLIFSIMSKIYCLKKKTFLNSAVDAIRLNTLEDLNPFSYSFPSFLNLDAGKFQNGIIEYEQFFQKKQIIKTFYYKNKKFFKTWKDFLE